MTKGNLGIIPPFDPEIDSTFHRLARYNRNLSLDSVPPFELIPLESQHFSSASIVPYFVHSSFGTSVASGNNSNYDFFYHHTFEKNMAQPPPRERTL